MVNQLKIFLQEKLAKTLPGEMAHREMAPYRKVNFTPTDLSQAILSAVLVLFYVKDKEIHISLMQRTVYKGKHSGQISFPGGKKESTDTDIYHTALRESFEEIGIIPEDVEVLGQLTDIYIPVSNFNVTPVIGVLNYTPVFNIDTREVETIIEVPLHQIKSKETIQTKKIKLNNSLEIKTPAYVFGESVVWGATSMMLNELRHLLNDWQP